MGETIVGKELIIKKLLEIEAELGELEVSLHDSLSELRNEWLDHQEKQLNDCNDRMIAMEETFQLAKCL